MKKIILIQLLSAFLLGIVSCNSGKSSKKNDIATDTASIAKGEKLFIQNCSSCHNFRQDGIGPQLSGITMEASAEWIRHFIKQPKQLIDSGDRRAQLLFEKYHVIMPSFAAYSDGDIDAVIAFLNTHNTVNKKTELPDSKAVKNPVPVAIALSGFTAQLKFVTQFPASSDSGKLPLTRITKLDYQPSSDDLFVVDLRGKLYRLHDDQQVVYMDIAKLEPAFIHTPGLGTGFGSFAFHPAFAKNGLMYTTHAEHGGAGKDDFNFPDSIKGTVQWVLTEWKSDQPGAATFSGRRRELLRITLATDMHGVQEIAFNPLSKPGDKDYGLLYICVGDGGAVENGYPFLAHNLQKVCGTILRIDPSGSNSRNGHYGIPSGNPFAHDKDKKIIKEIYAYGFRNPHRITWSHSGQMLVSNIGQANIESLNLIEPGNDYGWPIREGKFVVNPNGDLNKIYPLPADDSTYHITYPVAEFDHDEGRAICGGYEYQGKSIPQLKGKYLFGDIPSGRLFYVDIADLKQGKEAIVKEWKVTLNGEAKTLEGLSRTGRVDLHFGRDGKGELYILTKADGKLYKIMAADFK